MKSNFPQFRLKALPVAILALSPLWAQAAPGELTKTPLFLTTQVQPNVLMLVDDSGSMGWDYVYRDGADGSEDNRNRLLLCYGYNSITYDPNTVYTPWVGKDKNGNAFTDRGLTNAYNNPFAGTTSDITNRSYWEWDDKDADGKYDFGECSTKDSDRVYVKNLNAEQQKNYANWYSYYRTREDVTKRALSEIITYSKARIGLATLHNNQNNGNGGYASGYGFLPQGVKDIDDITTPIDSSAAASKALLLDNLFRIYSTGGTPLRRTLESAGKYFDTQSNTDLFNGNLTSPILPASKGGECQANYSIIMSDGYWNGDDPNVGNADKSDQPFSGLSYADSHSNTLADVAMYYYQRDLAPSLADKLPGKPYDPNTAQHMVTYTVSLGLSTSGGLQGTGKEGGPVSELEDPQWTNPHDGGAKTVDDMVHAAWNGRGEFLKANDTEELIFALSQAFLSIDEREGSASSVTFNSTRIDTDTFVFQANFQPKGWYGDLAAYNLDADGNKGIKQWSAGDLLESRNLLLKDRHIVTSNNNKGVPFRAPLNYKTATTSEMSNAMLADLLANAPHSANTTDPTKILANQAYLEKLVNYLRGWRTDEGGATDKFRSRTNKRLGDIINSSPVYSGVPKTAYPENMESVGYSTFIEAYKNRDPLVFVGANDGMLHAFDAKLGNEVFAYVPEMIASAASGEGLHFLAQQTYGHQPYVDGPLTVADVFIGGKWATYLVGALNYGGKGIYVLDVTDPSKLRESFASTVVKFEFTHKDLGYTFSKPQIGRLNNGKWAAIFGNGYNSDPTGDGRAKLFIVYLDGSGSVIIDTEQGSVANANCEDSASDCNGLSTPFLLDHTGDAYIDRVYAGDLHGNLWVFDLTSSTASNWGVAYKDSTTPKPLFQACAGTTCTKANRQPITAMPVIGVHPTRRNASTWPNLMVYFGTGQFIAKNDNFNTDQQSAYGIWDAGASHIGKSRDDLVEQVITTSGTARMLTSNLVNYLTGTGGQFGWYHDTPSTGERTVIDMLVDQKVIFYATLIPETSQCSAGGTGWLMFADRMTGGMPAFTVVDYNNDGVFDETPTAGLSLGAIPGGLSKLSDRLFLSDSAGKIISFKTQTGGYNPSRRTSWSVIH
ncbi:pilus assembly protein [Simiduia agarivorans]|uniref:Tfp pilus assembly protein, tip-associated adhesin PilY1 n=1 Tax=Simiduia agarivorans (strain DSM 21679 / JCM 13881 / BCRC 17597 / SA1) TaxID=1117647 RepID=K4KY91_SIMAS|nr:PilC/PilY family type IV pilus protein [Simiduia agarivorans]AFU98917.2 Tfp pilus assembly protein, tip-associated adhesin PilY1 [Simiduia agarivorans SA1 = DSM 21679]